MNFLLGSDCCVFCVSFISNQKMRDYNKNGIINMGWQYLLFLDFPNINVTNTIQIHEPYFISYTSKIELCITNTQKHNTTIITYISNNPVTCLYVVP